MLQAEDVAELVRHRLEQVVRNEAIDRGLRWCRLEDVFVECRALRSAPLSKKAELMYALPKKVSKPFRRSFWKTPFDVAVSRIRHPLDDVEPGIVREGAWASERVLTRTAARRIDREERAITVAGGRLKDPVPVTDRVCEGLVGERLVRGAGAPALRIFTTCPVVKSNFAIGLFGPLISNE